MTQPAREVRAWQAPWTRALTLCLSVAAIDGCAVGKGVVASADLDRRARATLGALVSSDTAAIDSLVLASTRTSATFPAVEQLARDNLPADVATGAQLIGSEMQVRGAEPRRYRVSYTFASADATGTIDIWFVAVADTPVVETISLAGKKRR